MAAFSTKAALRFFESEVEPTLGVDVYRHPFDPAIGWTVVEGPTSRILVLRYEDLATAPAALGAFLGSDPVPIPRRNETSAKPLGPAYAELRSDLALPVHALDRIYGSALCRHFYSPEEILAFRARWGARG